VTRALFPPRTNAVVRAILLAGACAAVGVPVALMAWVRTPNATGQFAPVSQPVAFDHRLHAGDLRIDCRYCHSAVERSAAAGIPPSTACMACHNAAWRDSKELAPVRQSIAAGRLLQWNRVDRLPDFVYFNHSIHVNKGVGCETCHGRVDRMSQLVQVAPMTMGWCVDCHRSPESHLRPVAAMTTMGWKPDEKQPAAGGALQAAYHVRELTNCTTCHR
jgi:hypothetical protein